jgi:hypothetical protein
MKELDKILAIVTEHYQQWEQNPDRMNNGYEFESTFEVMTQKIAKEMLEVSLGELPKSRNKKKGPLPNLEA